MSYKIYAILTHGTRTQRIGTAVLIHQTGKAVSWRPSRGVLMREIFGSEWLPSTDVIGRRLGDRRNRAGRRVVSASSVRINVGIARARNQRHHHYRER